MSRPAVSSISSKQYLLRIFYIYFEALDISNLKSLHEYCKQWTESDIFFSEGWSALNTPSTDGFKNPEFILHCLGTLIAWRALNAGPGAEKDKPMMNTAAFNKGLTWQRGGVV